MTTDHCDEVGFPAPVTTVTRTPDGQGNRWRNSFWREKEQERRRARYRAAKAAGMTCQEARRVASRVRGQ